MALFPPCNCVIPFACLDKGIRAIHFTPVHVPPNGLAHRARRSPRPGARGTRTVFAHDGREVDSGLAARCARLYASAPSARKARCSGGGEVTPGEGWIFIAVCWISACFDGEQHPFGVKDEPREMFFNFGDTQFFMQLLDLVVLPSEWRLKGWQAME